eukprot:m.136320 g.136320  ORF g.136320 m.136320 type:complete len:659 (+) comp13137_c0_seq3:53-2029(+)
MTKEGGGDVKKRKKSGQGATVGEGRTSSVEEKEKQQQRGKKENKKSRNQLKGKQAVVSNGSDTGATSGQVKSLQSAATGATWSIFLQVVLRLVTFASNGIIVRISSSTMLGIVNVRLLLLYSTIVFLAREPVRKACLSVRNSQLTASHWQMVVNLIWFGIVASFVLATTLSLFWLFYLQRPEDLSYYTIAVVSYALSAVVEVAAEPYWIFYQIKLNSKLKAVIETQSLIAGVIVLLGGLYFFPELGLVVPSAAQLVRKFYILFAYVFKLNWDLNRAKASIAPVQSNVQMLFSAAHNGELPWYKYIPESIAKIAASFVLHGVVKQALTEGERYIMTFGHMLTFAEQGVYDVVNSLGSLVPRMLFHPIEEDYYTFFAALLSREEEDTCGKKEENTADEKGVERDIAKVMCEADEKLASLTLSTLLKLVVLIGIVFTCFGQAYSYLLLFIYGGESLANGEGVVLLRATCMYVFLLAVNGITECFVSAFSSKREIDEHNWYMFYISVAYALASIYFTATFGAVGFVMANGVNMVLRISKSLYDIQHYLHQHNHMLLEGHPILNSIPCSSVLITLCLSMGVTMWSESVLIGETYSSQFQGGVAFTNIAQHIAVGAVCFFSSMFILYTAEKDFLRHLVVLWRGDGKPSRRVGTKSQKQSNKKMK